MINLCGPSSSSPSTATTATSSATPSSPPRTGIAGESHPARRRRRPRARPANTAEKTGKVTTGRVCIDNDSTADVVEDIVIRDRQHLCEDGIFLPIIAINKRTGQVEGSPEIIMRGFAVDDPELLRNARDIVVRTLEDSSDEERRTTASSRKKSAATSSASSRRTPTAAR